MALVVTITNPTNNSTVQAGSTVPFTVEATSDVPVLVVHFHIDGKVVHSITTERPYVYQWAVPRKPKAYNLFAKALDEAGNNVGSQAFLVTAVR